MKTGMYVHKRAQDKEGREYSSLGFKIVFVSSKSRDEEGGVTPEMTLHLQTHSLS